MYQKLSFSFFCRRVFISLVLPCTWPLLWFSFDKREEGHKDPFSSVFKYMEKAPKHIYYDNACQLSEYCLNREPEFFKHIRFWHDLFHSIGHKCGLNFKSGRIHGLAGINSEICEQVNSFLQCIKYTGSHLSQENFIFFVQFFLHLIAVAGHI